MGNGECRIGSKVMEERELSLKDAEQITLKWKISI